MAAWNPVSRGGANTGTTPRTRHTRMTRPTTSLCWCAPWKIVSLSNWAYPGSPTSRQCLDGRLGGDHGHRPRADQAAVQRGGVEHFDVGAPLDHQPLDDVEAVQLGPPRRDVRQIPPRRRRGPADSAAGVHYPAPPENAVDGTQPRGRSGAP